MNARIDAMRLAMLAGDHHVYRHASDSDAIGAFTAGQAARDSAPWIGRRHSLRTYSTMKPL